MLGVDLIVWDTGNASLSYNNYKTRDYGFYLFKTPTKITLEGKEIVTEPFSLILYKPNTLQTFRGVDGSWRFDFFEFSGPESEELISKLKIPVNQLFHVSDPLYISSLMKKLTRETIHRYEFRAITLDVMIRNFLYTVGTMYWKITSNTASIRDRYVSALKSIRQDMVNHPEYPWNVPDMAKKLNVSESYFRKLYTTFHEISPKDDLANIRIQRAEYLLNCEGMSVKETAFAVGFNNEFHFIRIFKKKVGVSPGVFMKNHRGGDVVDN